MQHWKAKDLIQEWKGRFISSPHNDHENNIDDNFDDRGNRDFFGFPSLPPFYVGKDGMQSISQGVLEDIIIRRTSTSNNNEEGNTHNLNLFTGARVAQLERDEESKRWKIFGTTGIAVFHDTPEKLFSNPMAIPMI